MRLIAISQHGMNFSSVLPDQELVRQYSSKISCSTPSIMFQTEDLEKTHDAMKVAGVTVAEIFCRGDENLQFL